MRIVLSFEELANMLAEDFSNFKVKITSVCPVKVETSRSVLRFQTSIMSLELNAR